MEIYFGILLGFLVYVVINFFIDIVMMNRRIKLAKYDQSKTPEIEHIQRLDIKDGDIIVVKSPIRMRDPQVIREVIQGIAKKAGKDVQVLIMECGNDIGIINKVDKQETK